MAHLPAVTLQISSMKRVQECSSYLYPRPCTFVTGSPSRKVVSATAASIDADGIILCYIYFGFRV